MHTTSACSWPSRRVGAALRLVEKYIMAMLQLVAWCKSYYFLREASASPWPPRGEADALRLIPSYAVAMLQLVSCEHRLWATLVAAMLPRVPIWVSIYRSEQLRDRSPARVATADLRDPLSDPTEPRRSVELGAGLA